MKKLVICFFTLLLLSSVPVFAAENVADTAGVLTPEQVEALDKTLCAVRDDCRFDLVVLTTVGLESYERMPTADDYYDYNGYGWGKSRDGALLLVNISPDGRYYVGNSWVSTCGKGITLINDSAIEAIGDRLTPMLQNGQYADAFDTFASMVRSDVQSYRIKGVLIGAVIALIFALLVMSARSKKLKREMISVREATEANSYVVAGSLNLHRSYDHFLYSSVTRTERAKSSDGGGGSHTSSSGTSHGGGGF